MTLATRRKERERGEEETVYCNYQLLGERRDISDKAATAAVCTAITQSIIAREIHKVHPLLSAQTVSAVLSLCFISS